MVNKEKRQLYNQRYYNKKKMGLVKITLPELLTERSEPIYNDVLTLATPPPNPFDFIFLFLMKAYDFIKCKLFFKY